LRREWRYFGGVFTAHLPEGVVFVIELIIIKLGFIGIKRE
jgi:hypothetical protein